MSKFKYYLEQENIMMWSYVFLHAYIYIYCCCIPERLIHINAEKIARHIDKHLGWCLFIKKMWGGIEKESSYMLVIPQTVPFSRVQSHVTLLRVSIPSIMDMSTLVLWQKFSSILQFKFCNFVVIASRAFTVDQQNKFEC